VVAVDVEEPAEKAVEFRRRHALTFPIVADPKRRLFNHFFFPPNYNLPYMILVGKDGAIRMVDVSLQSLPRAIEHLL
jgi:peroxiredoxin